MDSSNDELWRRVRRFRNYQISSFGHVKDDDGVYVEPYLNRDGELCILLDSNEWMYKGPLWRLMLHNWYEGNTAGVEFRYNDEDPTNLNLDNLTPIAKDEVEFTYPILFQVDIHGTRILHRRPTRRGKKVRIVETNQVFESVQECAEEIGGNRSSIYSVLRGNLKTHLGLTFEWV